MYDLLIKGGHVFDPGQSLDSRLDIAVKNGRIAAIQPDIPAAEGRQLMEIRGDHRRIVPGLIDLHTHVAYGAQTPGVNWQGADPDVAGVHSGVTTVVDCGSTGAYNFGLFPTHVMPRARTRVICFLNVGSHGLLYMHKQQPDVAAWRTSIGRQSPGASRPTKGWSAGSSGASWARWCRSVARSSYSWQLMSPASIDCR